MDDSVGFTMRNCSFSIKKDFNFNYKAGQLFDGSIVNSIANCGAAYYLFSMSSTPDSLIHINPAASSFAVFSLYFLVISSCLYKFGTHRVLILISAICGSIAISIRPYLGPFILLLEPGILLGHHYYIWDQALVAITRGTSKIELVIYLNQVSLQSFGLFLFYPYLSLQIVLRTCCWDR